MLIEGNWEVKNNKQESINNYKELFFEYTDKLPTLKEALEQMFKSIIKDKNKINELIIDIKEKCKTTIDNNWDEIKNKYKNITVVDAYIICSYTCESKEKDYSPYKILNQNLVSKDRKQGVQNISKYLYILLKSLRKLPKHYPNTDLYRCIKTEVDLENNDSKTFWGFTSTSTDEKTAYKFLDNNNEIKSGTLFKLEGNIWGYDIELFNKYREKEILLEPERKYIVKYISYEPVIKVTCSMIESPLVLEEPQYVVKIEKDKDKYELGLLCHIPNKKINALITYNHILDLQFLNNAQKLKILLNDDIKEINMKINRYKYTNKELDITIIEILDEDNINKYIEIDDKFFNLHNYAGINILSVGLKNERLDGIILCKKNNNFICSSVSINEGIILLKDNLKLIGLIKVYNNNLNEIEFIPMDIIINEINFIKCKYEIKEKDIVNKIQIINNEHESNHYTNDEIKKNIQIIINGEIKSIINSEPNKDYLKYKFTKTGIYNIYFISRNYLYNMSYMFFNCSTLIEIDFASFNSNKVKAMDSMFQGCISLKNINLSSFNTSHVINMRNLFFGCSSLEKINLSTFKTDEVKFMSYMFYECKSLKEIDLSSFNTKKVFDMEGMFGGCESLKKLNVSSFKTYFVENMSSMFEGCKLLEELNLISFEPNDLRTISSMFSDCSKLKKLKLASFKINSECKREKVFNGCRSLKNLECENEYVKKLLNKELDRLKKIKNNIY